jgi:hypothetical protein
MIEADILTITTTVLTMDLFMEVIYGIAYMIAGFTGLCVVIDLLKRWWLNDHTNG